MMQLALLLCTATREAFGMLRAVFLYLLPRKQPGAGVHGYSLVLCLQQESRRTLLVRRLTNDYNTGLLLYSGAGPQVLLYVSAVIIARWAVGMPAL